MRMKDIKPKVKVLIVSGSVNYKTLVESMGYEALDIGTLKEAQEFNYCDVDVVLFTGGADVNPELYGHTKHPTTGYSMACDALDLEVFNLARKTNSKIKFAGICRGSQFLCVMAGGKLIQDCKNHAIWGTHEATDFEGVKYWVTSTHHQMQYPLDVQHKVLAWSDNIASNCEMHVDGEVVKVDMPMDYEAVWYPDIKALAFQPHPEFAGAKTTKELFIKLFNQFVVYGGLTLVK